MYLWEKSKLLNNKHFPEITSQQFLLEVSVFEVSSRFQICVLRNNDGRETSELMGFYSNPAQLQSCRTFCTQRSVVFVPVDNVEKLHKKMDRLNE